VRREDARVRVMPGMLEVADRERDELWELSLARDQQRKRQELDALRLQYHIGQSKRLRLTMTDLITPHENEARKLTEGSGA
jgi:hypothetical protein